MAGEQHFVGDRVLRLARKRRRINLQTSTANNNHVLRIGDANKYVLENETYVIKYKIQGVIKNFEGENFDQIYWNVTGDQWDVTIKKSSAKITLPSVSTINKKKCFTGKFGNADSECISGINKNFAVFSKNTPLLAGDGLTVLYGFDKNISTANLKFEKPVFTSFIHNIFNPLSQKAKPQIDSLLIYLFPFLVAIWSVLNARKNKKSLEVNKPIIAKYHTPENLHPSVMGTVLDGTFNKQDFVAGIINLATKGFVTITKRKVKGLFSEKTEYLIRPIKNNKQKLIEGSIDKFLFSELFLLKKIFIPSQRPERMHSIFLQMSFNAKANIFFKESYRIRTSHDFLASTKIKQTLTTIAIYAVIIITQIHLNLLIITTIISIVIGVIGVIHYYPKRSAKGFKMAYEIKCFKEFLKTAELEQLNWSSKQEIFEQNLPYAIAFGLEGKWTELFGDLIIPPKNISGLNSNNMNDFSENIARITQNFSSNIQAPQSSEGSGFSSSGGFGSGGGGFSGGGSGGGGGSSW